MTFKFPVFFSKLCPFLSLIKEQSRFPHPHLYKLKNVSCVAKVTNTVFNSFRIYLGNVINTLKLLKKQSTKRPVVSKISSKTLVRLAYEIYVVRHCYGHPLVTSAIFASCS